jgi:nucleotide-binding universal stress UspA family protein
MNCHRDANFGIADHSSRVIAHDLAGDTIMTATTTFNSEQAWECETPTTGGIVVGFDGSPGSRAAIETAAAISKANDWNVHVVSVLPPMSSYKLNLSMTEPRSEIEDLRVQLRDAAIRDAIGASADRERWTREVVVGKAPTGIATVACERLANLIILGRTQRRGLERFIGGETATQVMHSTTVPVLLVDDEMSKPSTIVAAVDFRMASARAASLALQMLADRGTLYLVHIEEPVEAVPDGTTAPDREQYPREALGLFRRLFSGLRPRPGVVIETIVLNGSPVPTIAEFCERVGADLLVAGSRGLPAMARVILGSVSLGLAKKVRIPILIAPAKN